MKDLNKIIKVEPKDLSRIEVLARKTWPDTYKDILSEDQLVYMLDWMYCLDTLSKQLQNGQLFYIYTLNGQDAGFVGVEPNYEGKKALRIHKIYVLPKFQSKGIGADLVNFLKGIALDLNNQTLHLNVNKYNKSVGFYEHLGFKKIAEEDIDIGKGYFMNDFVMELILK